jgi:hypothetical protein
MLRIRSVWPIFALIFCAAVAGCGAGTNQFGGQPGSGGNSSVVLAMTDAPPTLVSVLSAQVTLTGATLAPGNVSVLSAPVTVDLARLQTDIAYIGTATKLSAGNFTSVTLTFANPKLTIENDMATTIAGCLVGQICTLVPTASPLSTTVPLTAFSIPASGATGLLIDVNLDNLLTASLGEDFSTGTTVIPFIPAGTNAPAVGAEDVVGQVGNLNASAKTFTLTNATGTYSLKSDTTSTFFQFPIAGSCTAQVFACLQNGQILSVDIGIQFDGSILARNVVFEDPDSSDAEIEGIVTKTTNLGVQQFDIVIQTMSSSVSGLSIGQPITVQFSTVPPTPTPFGVDLVHADNFQVSTSGFLFTAPVDLSVGQQVSVRRNSASTASLIKADRVLLRSTRVTANVQTALPLIFLSPLPSLFSGHGITGITTQVSVNPPTIYYEVGKIINSSNVVIGVPVSARGPLFIVGSGRTLIATKIVVK